MSGCKAHMFHCYEQEIWAGTPGKESWKEHKCDCKKEDETQAERLKLYKKIGQGINGFVLFFK